MTETGPSDGRVEVRGVIAMNGRGEWCFFAHSRADGVPIPMAAAGASPSLRELRVLADFRKAVEVAPTRRVTHSVLAEVDPDDLRIEEDARDVQELVEDMGAGVSAGVLVDVTWRGALRGIGTAIGLLRRVNRQVDFLVDADRGRRRDEIEGARVARDAVALAERFLAELPDVHRFHESGRDEVLELQRRLLGLSA
jgi:hypothetical protein